MNVQTKQDLLLKQCSKRFLHRTPFAAVQNAAGRVRSSAQANRNISCQVTTKLPANKVQHHSGAVTDNFATSKESRRHLKPSSKLADFLLLYSSDLEAVT